MDNLTNNINFPKYTHIDVFSNVFSSDWCDNIINTYKSYDFTGVNYSIFFSKLNYKLFEEFQKIILKKVYPFYRRMYPILNNLNLGVIREAKLHLYKANHYTVPEHCENHGWHPYRCIGINLYLNTIKQGGEDIFFYQQTGITPQQGGVLLFPAHYTHINKSNIPQHEDKYVLKSWIEFNTQ